MANPATITEKSELLFLYESTYSIPNGDPFTGEQRYDDETKKVLVSDVRIKRFIRDFIINEAKNDVYVWNDQSMAEGKESGSAARVKSLKEKYKGDNEIFVKTGDKINCNTLNLLKKCIDVRLFGAISTEEGDAVNLTGPVQFSLLNPSLNKVDLRTHQNTTVFPSKSSNKQGSIGTTSIVPYSLNQIHGWINPKSALKTGLTEDDVKTMFKSLWNSINDANTRSKSNQNSLLLLQLVYQEDKNKLYSVDKVIKIKPKESKREEQLRSLDDFTFDFAELITIAKDQKIKEIRYFTECTSIKEQFKEVKEFKNLDLI
ncbi:MAG: type I-B CRISPR-associated protein Cas7/Csh2 [Candidatus Kapabacteria bacterium]|nr:type I-B CRISPR-associated protein Cas7/Csh2 [Candidatus Kapabacteria bacterium]